MKIKRDKNGRFIKGYISPRKNLELDKLSKSDLKILYIYNSTIDSISDCNQIPF